MSKADDWSIAASDLTVDELALRLERMAKLGETPGRADALRVAASKLRVLKAAECDCDSYDDSEDKRR